MSIPTLMLEIVSASAMSIVSLMPVWLFSGIARFGVETLFSV